ncbi:MAG: hypothetical protein EA397_02290 [Deltaproteobacteria bacterium]|nr:MAG: hypothetical protein EA397_02290 [Deltaproteobacteria bacterium]
MTQPTVTLKQRACPACAAPMPPVSRDAHHVKCAYCGQSFEVVKRSPPQRRQKPPRRGAKPAKAATPASSSKPAEEPKERGSVVLMILVLVLGFGGFFLSAGAGTIATIVAVVHPEFGSYLADLAGEEIPTPLPPRETRGLTWVDHYSAPAVVDANRDGRLDLIALFQTHEGPNPQTWLGVFRGKDLRELWRYGPLVGPPMRQVGAVVAGERLVVLEPFGVVSVVDLASGRRFAQHQLPKNPSMARMCLMEIGGSKVMIDGQMIVDAATGAAQTQRVPAWHRRPDHCVYQRLPGTTAEAGDRYARQLGLPVAGRRESKKPSFEGLKVERAFVDGPHGVAVASAVRGPPARSLVGFAANGFEERWRVPIDALRPETPDPAMDLIDLGLNTVVFTYRPSAHGGAIVIALDAQSGQKRWEHELGKGSLLATFGDGRVWIRVHPHGKNGFVRILDLETGEAQTFGGWN